MMRKQLLLILVSFLFPLPLFAFDPNYIIGDADVIDYESMTLGHIQNFLEQKGGALAYTLIQDRDGGLKRPADIIYLSCLEYKINPKLMLALLQKEQSLIEDKNPKQGQYDWATGYAACDACDVSEPGIARFKGFAKQVNSAAAQIRYYMEHPTELTVKPQMDKVISGQKVTPQNIATASLYTYTPHISGNQNFWTIWNRWFGITRPDGTVVSIENAKGKIEYWLIANGTRRKIASKSVLNSRFDPKKIIAISQKDLENYPPGKEIKFPQYSLLQVKSGKIHLLTNDMVRPIENNNTFKKLGFNWDEVVSITEEDLKSFRLGEPITAKATNLTGTLIQNKKTGGVYWVQEGKKSPIISKLLLKLNYPTKKIVGMAEGELAKFETARPVGFKEGELIASIETKEVYVISNGLRRKITSTEKFSELGYRWDNVINVDEKLILLHEQGDPLS
ncbi:MAG: hypothetical protein G01um101418_961 [Parcubacteria group bacterium Gr01-1014_18]|nr:MAG: hypothetical protein Greene041636_967 [Parcubacteria group bacterium Greene0416_36]TSC79520.1 MAG: hypothetical protein G01um101418_961 [Parcubacteria group bacterium Gr01-1014_18]TSC97992.1 MAG: hypothetical protein Greene101420_919 [Parcubacteria group bacterium Greene1014_20]TSD06134.1 MAG: hypothetical protein Greene07142_942 [Parcubacteria group bacterium Greene0714_2]